MPSPLRGACPWLLGAVLLACSDSAWRRSGEPEPQAEWKCSASADGCSCKAFKPGVISSFGSHDLQCLAYGCCLLDRQQTEWETASCECFDGDVDCEAEASSRRDGTSVVSQCPPEGEGPAPKACAQLAENCRPSYLQQHDLSGCCAGSICEANELGVPVCREASAAETELLQECSKGAQATGTALALTDGVLETSAGTWRFDALRPSALRTGPEGCLTGLDLRFEAGGGSCSLTLRTELREGRVVVSSLLGFVQSCPGFAGSILDGALAGASGLENIAFTFEGLACNASLVFESYCVAGRFDLHFQGVTSGTVSIADEHLTAEGVVCGALSPQGSCPQP